MSKQLQPNRPKIKNIETRVCSWAKTERERARETEIMTTEMILRALPIFSTNPDRVSPFGSGNLRNLCSNNNNRNKNDFLLLWIEQQHLACLRSISSICISLHIFNTRHYSHCLNQSYSMYQKEKERKKKRRFLWLHLWFQYSQ